LAAAGAALESAAVWRRARRLGGDVVVRCRRGHLFTTLWIPGVSLKAARIGPWRAQYCPVGRHWTIVAPAAEAKLSAEQLRLARQRHDLRIP
jgi:hypothetical protein